MSNKLFPCTECGATGRDPHKLGCSIGMKRSANARKAAAARKINKAKVTVPPIPTLFKAEPDSTIVINGHTYVLKKETPLPKAKKKVTPKPQLVNRIAIVMDSSSSVYPFQEEIIGAANSQLNEIKNQAAEKGQSSYVTLNTFATCVNAPIYKNHYIHGISEISSREYYIGGMTSLNDAIGNAIESFESLSDSDDLNVSFLVVVITDGYENNSSKWSQRDLAAKIKRLQGTDRWTFAFSGPPGCSDAISSNLGIHPGNIQEWEGSGLGAIKMSIQNTTGIGTFYTTRSAGGTSTQNFYTVDMSQVSETAIANLTDLKNDFTEWVVNKGEVQIRDFVNERLTHAPLAVKNKVGTVYTTGRAYYELTKPEKLGVTKDLLIKDRTTGQLYGGREARTLLGIPDGNLRKLTPGNLMNYKLFVKSTSVNRLLVRGTSVMYKTSF